MFKSECAVLPTDRPGLNLTRSINKMTTLQRQIETLVGYAYSGKLAFVLQERQFGIQVLPNVTSGPPDWPSTLAEWAKIGLRRMLEQWF